MSKLDVYTEDPAVLERLWRELCEVKIEAGATLAAKQCGYALVTLHLPSQTMYVYWEGEDGGKRHARYCREVVLLSAVWSTTPEIVGAVELGPITRSMMEEAIGRCER